MLRYCRKFYSGSDGARWQVGLEGAQDFLARHRLGANSLVAFYQAQDGRYVSGQAARQRSLRLWEASLLGGWALVASVTLRNRCGCNRYKEAALLGGFEVSLEKCARAITGLVGRKNNICEHRPRGPPCNLGV
jgi:hypothetical protein